MSSDRGAGAQAWPTTAQRHCSWPCPAQAADRGSRSGTHVNGPRQKTYIAGPIEEASGLHTQGGHPRPPRLGCSSVRRLTRLLDGPSWLPAPRSPSSRPREIKKRRMREMRPAFAMIVGLPAMRPPPVNRRTSSGSPTERPPHPRTLAPYLHLVAARLLAHSTRCRGRVSIVAGSPRTRPSYTFIYLYGACLVPLVSHIRIPLIPHSVREL